MIEYLLIFLFIIFVLFSENILKIQHITFLYNNFDNIKYIIKNILYILPILLVYFNYGKVLKNFQ